MPHFSKEKLRENERAFEVNDLDYQCFNIIVASLNIVASSTKVFWKKFS